MLQFRKLFFFALYLLVFSVLAFRLKVFFFGQDGNLVYLAQTALFVIILGTYVWFGSFASTFHLYLQVSQSSVRTNLVWALSGEVVLSLIAHFGFEIYRKFNFWSLLVDPTIFAIAFAIMFYWVRTLSFSGFFSGNILWLSLPANFTASDSWLQDHHRRKNIKHISTESFVASDLERLIIAHQINEVVFLEYDLSKSELAQSLQFLQEKKIGYFIITDGKFWRGNEAYDLRYLIRGYTNHDSLLNISLKRIFDLTISTLVLGLLFPLFVFIGIVIKLDDPGSVFYVSRRVGKKGKIIRFMKFRSMIADADKQKAALMALNERSGGPLFKMKNDPRITRVGRILRKYSLDELPQFINVFRGELSLVGPRPHLESEVAHYENYDFQRMDCIPGITCFAQIRDRNGTSFREWIDLDLKYRNQWNFLLDFRILFLTVRVVLAPVAKKLRGEKVDVY